MRDIKFRAWDGKKMYDNDSIVVYLSAGWIENASLDSGAIHIKSGVDHLMQFTGLTDKNGVDIYEGDILISDLGRICKVEWYEYQAGFDCVFIKDTDFKKDIDMSRGFKNPHLNILTEVIGNIHQNKDLLGG